MNENLKPGYRLIYAIPLIFAMTAIFIASHQESIQLPDMGIEWQDKVLHFIAYFVFGVTVLLAFVGIFRKITTKWLLVLAIIFGCLFGLSDEFHQSFVPGRDCDFFDWLADAIGIVVSTVLSVNIKNIIEKIDYKLFKIEVKNGTKKST